MNPTITLGLFALALLSLIGAFIHLMRSTGPVTPDTARRTSCYALISIVLSCTAIGSALIAYIAQLP